MCQLIVDCEVYTSLSSPARVDVSKSRTICQEPLHRIAALARFLYTLGDVQDTLRYASAASCWSSIVCSAGAWGKGVFRRCVARSTADPAFERQKPDLHGEPSVGCGCRGHKGTSPVLMDICAIRCSLLRTRTTGRMMTVCN